MCHTQYKLKTYIVYRDYYKVCSCNRFYFSIIMMRMRVYVGRPRLYTL